MSIIGQSISHLFVPLKRTQRDDVRYRDTILTEEGRHVKNCLALNFFTANPIKALHFVILVLPTIFKF